MGQLSLCIATSEPTHPRVQALWQEEPLQWEACMPLLESCHCSPHLEKTSSNEDSVQFNKDPVQPKIFFNVKKKKKQWCIRLQPLDNGNSIFQLLRPRPCQSSLLPPFLSQATFTVSKGGWQDLQHTPDPSTSPSVTAPDQVAPHWFPQRQNWSPCVCPCSPPLHFPSGSPETAWQ